MGFEARLLINSPFRHRFIVIYKTAYYSFYLPVALAMHMTHIPTTYTLGSSLGSSETDPYKLAVDILLPLGEYFQIQDDFLDYSGTPEQIGKIGTDIIDNKCSWCINTALAVASPAQRKVLDENYGRKDSKKEAAVKVVFEEVGIPARYKEYEENAYRRIMGMIEQIPKVKATPTYADEPAVLQRQVFKTFLDKIYKRTK
jgi:farnesyl diphosphate synthase